MVDAQTVISFSLVDVCVSLVVSIIFIESGSSHSHGHTHTQTGEKPTGFHDPNVVQDAGHIKEHYEGRANIDENNMTPEELEFHYFQLHDFDNNTKLDGLEILAALTHLIPYDGNSTDAEGQKVKTDSNGRREDADEQLLYYTDIIDSVLLEDDIDKDGYLTYLEFVLARHREDARVLREEEELKTVHKEEHKDPH